jgi:hypothetical protein
MRAKLPLAFPSAPTPRCLASKSTRLANLDLTRPLQDVHESAPCAPRSRAVAGRDRRSAIWLALRNESSFKRRAPRCCLAVRCSALLCTVAWLLHWCIPPAPDKGGSPARERTVDPGGDPRGLRGGMTPRFHLGGCPFRQLS